MKLRLLISTLIAILVTFSCSKNDTKKHSVSNLSQLKGNRSLKNLKKIDQLKELMDGNAKAKIACYISSDAMNIAWGGKPYYNVTGYVDDSNPDDSYDLTIG